MLSISDSLQLNCLDWFFLLQTSSFSHHKMFIEGLESCGLLKDYCDAFINCLNYSFKEYWGLNNIRHIHFFLFYLFDFLSHTVLEDDNWLINCWTIPLNRFIYYITYYYMVHYLNNYFTDKIITVEHTVVYIKSGIYFDCRYLVHIKQNPLMALFINLLLFRCNFISIYIFHILACLSKLYSFVYPVKNKL